MMDDQTDMINNVREYIKTKPKYKSSTICESNAIKLLRRYI